MKTADLPKKNHTTAIIVGSVLGGVILVLLVLLIFIVFVRKTFKKVPESNPKQPNLDIESMFFNYLSIIRE
jgi:hypothetical protein